MSDGLDLGPIDPGATPLRRHLNEGVHPWSPTALSQWEAGVVPAAEVEKAAHAISYHADHSEDEHQGVDWPDRWDSIEIVIVALTTLGLKPERPE